MLNFQLFETKRRNFLDSRTTPSPFSTTPSSFINRFRSSTTTTAAATTAKTPTKATTTSADDYNGLTRPTLKFRSTRAPKPLRLEKEFQSVL